MRTAFLACLIVTACSAQAPSPGGAIAPLDGQTRVPVDQDLLVLAPGLVAPGDTPLPADLIEVVDLDAGGFVAGEVRREGDLVRFTPNQEWRFGVEYLWVVQQPLPEARRVGLELPQHLTGEALFRAGSGSTVLDAGVDEDGSVCLLLSRHVSHKPLSLEITLDDVPAGDGEWEVIHEPDVLDVTLLPGDTGVSYVCWREAPGVADGTRLRAWWGERGPWSFELESRTPATMVQALRRSR